MLNFCITSMWNSEPSKDPEVNINISTTLHGLEVTVLAPFFNSPKSPAGKPGESFNNLWDYEVVEMFFLDENREKYLEVELCPHGQYLVLLLNGPRNIIKTCRDFNFSATIKDDSWTGKVLIPWDYLPSSLTYFNAYAISGENEKRQYKALYPTPPNKYDEPNFHRLNYFTQLDKSWLANMNSVEESAGKIGKAFPQ